MRLGLLAWLILLLFQGFPSEIARVPVIDTVPHDVIIKARYFATLFSDARLGNEPKPDPIRKGLAGMNSRCIVPVITFVLVSVLDIAG